MDPCYEMRQLANDMDERREESSSQTEDLVQHLAFRAYWAVPLAAKANAALVRVSGRDLL